MGQFSELGRKNFNGREMMRKLVFTCLVCLFLVTPSFATLTPIGTYTLTFERNGWSESKVLSVQPFPTAESFYQVGGEDVNVYLQYVGQYGYGNQISGYTWYVNAPAVLGDDSLNLLGGTGDLTITVSDFTLAEDPNALFMPLVTHLYYVNDLYGPMDIPGSIPVSPGTDQLQRSPVLPVGPTEADYNPSNPYYGTPYEDFSSGKITAVLPDMYVPNGTMWELSFGLGFASIPEPSVILFLLAGFAAIKRIKR